MYKACQDIKETIIPDEFLERDTNMPFTRFTMRALMYCILKTKANKFLEDAPLLMKKCMVACQACCICLVVVTVISTSDVCSVVSHCF